MPNEENVRLFMRHQKMLREFILSLVHHSDDAEDLLQEVSVVVLTRSEPPGDLAKFPAWCRGVARNIVLHYWRDRRKTMTPPTSLFLDSVELAFREADSGEEELSRRRKALQECLKRLPEPSRKMLELRYVRRASSDEVARMLGRSAAGIRMMLMRVRQALGACIEGRMAGET